jgi:F-type H+-transporting ATPase subunit b
MTRRQLAILLLAIGLAALVLPGLVTAAEETHGEEAEHGAGGSGELIFKWINFFIVFGGGGYFAAGPFRRWVAGQRQAIKDRIAEAQTEKRQAEERLAQIEQRLAGLEEEIKALRREAVEDAAAEGNRIAETARREAERILATTVMEIDSAGRAARLELRAYAARLAVTLAEQRIQERLTPKIHAVLFEASLSELPAAEAGGSPS